MGPIVMRISAASFPVLIVLAVAPCGPSSGERPTSDAPERRAMAYLEQEVPRWSKVNRCFSCHNNGDAARALFASVATPYAPKPEAMADTIEFLSHPDRWDRNGADGPFSDKTLARVQFAHALDAAIAAGKVVDRSSLVIAADGVAKDQAKDGSWAIDQASPIGSPSTYGPALATAIARTTLHHADPARFASSIARADRWMRDRAIQNTLDAAAWLMALPDDPKARDAIAFLRRAQNDDGGWGPFSRSSSEPFDTALALLALDHARRVVDIQAMSRRGRVWLISSQKPDGSWPETTRPEGGESYAQRLSTTGWAALALVVTRSKE